MSKAKFDRFTVRKVLSRSDLRNVCIQHEYYTRGDCDEYENLFRMVEDVNGRISLDDYDIMQIAKDIYNHSNIEQKMKEYGCDEYDVMASILFNIHNACTTLVRVHREED